LLSKLFMDGSQVLSATSFGPFLSLSFAFHVGLPPLLSHFFRLPVFFPTPRDMDKDRFLNSFLPTSARY